MHSPSVTQGSHSLLGKYSIPLSYIYLVNTMLETAQITSEWETKWTKLEPPCSPVMLNTTAPGYKHPITSDVSPCRKRYLADAFPGLSKPGMDRRNEENSFSKPSTRISRQRQDFQTFSGPLNTFSEFKTFSRFFPIVGTFVTMPTHSHHSYEF